LDEELLLMILKTSSYDFLLKLISLRFPKEVVEIIEIWLRTNVKLIIEVKRREIEGKPPLSGEETLKLMGKCLESTVPPELRNWFQTSINELKIRQKKSSPITE